MQFSRVKRKKRRDDRVRVARFRHVVGARCSTAVRKFAEKMGAPASSKVVVLRIRQGQNVDGRCLFIVLCLFDSQGFTEQTFFGNTLIVSTNCLHKTNYLWYVPNMSPR